MFDFETGEVLLIDKAYHQTSFQAVKTVKYWSKAKKVGHAGTLDPLATGLLILCTGKKTKEIDRYQGMTKVYTGTIELGIQTPSYDLETEVSERKSTDHLNLENIRRAMDSFVGEIDQMPPVFSAIKVDGKRAYKSARQGEEVQLKSRKITIEAFDLVERRENAVDFRVVCSKGTYIRSLAHDLGQKLGCGGTLTALRREAIGEFSVQDALTTEQFIALMKSEHARISEA